MKRSVWRAGLGLMGALLITQARADEPPDDGLLEFLGSVDSEDQAWHDYLARTDIDQVAAAAPAPARPRPAPPSSDPPADPAAKPVAPRPATPP